MAWVIWMGVGGVVAVAVWSWVSRERDVQQDRGTVSIQWRNEQRLNPPDLFRSEDGSHDDHVQAGG
jgi:hypothetical protein